MEEHFNNFCHMMIEEFLMQKGMQNTLQEFRKEWERPEENMSLLSWYEMALKLHLPEIASRAKYGTVLENVSWEMMSDASMRMRKSPEVIVSGMAMVPKAPKLPSLDLVPATTSERKKDSTYMYEYQKYTMASDAALIANAKKKLYEEANETDITKRHYNPSQAKRMAENAAKNRSSSSNWIPDETRYKQLGRDLLVAKENLHDIIMRNEETRRENRALGQTDLERAHVMEKLGVKHKIECACCLQMFSYVNLRLKVSHKAIIDIRNIWSNGEKGWWSADDERWGVVPRCYDDVLVCLICSQFFHKQGEYRPSFEQTEYEKRKQAHFEAKRREKEYWDPLRMVEKDRELMEEAQAMEAAVQLQQQALEEEQQHQQVDHALEQGSGSHASGHHSMADAIKFVIANPEQAAGGAHDGPGAHKDDETLASNTSEL
jgi:hypothetical protein